MLWPGELNPEFLCCAERSYSVRSKAPQFCFVLQGFWLTAAVHPLGEFGTAVAGREGQPYGSHSPWCAAEDQKLSLIHI